MKILRHLLPLASLALVCALVLPVTADPAPQLAPADTSTIEPAPPVQVVAVLPTAEVVRLTSEAATGALDHDPVARSASGDLCLDCDTNADCDRLCGARGYSGGWCLRDLFGACSIYPDDKVCVCL